MSDKLEIYVDLFQSGVLAGESQQASEKKIFPHILIISEQRYAIDGEYPFRIIQAPSFDYFLQSLKPKEKAKNNSTPVKSNNGAIRVNIGG